jgi:hypothetical protein
MPSLFLCVVEENFLLNVAACATINQISSIARLLCSFPDIGQSKIYI